MRKTTATAAQGDGFRALIHAIQSEVVPRFSSRKFLFALASFTGAVLSSAGVIDATAEAEFTGYLAPLLYIVVEGALDAR